MPVVVVADDFGMSARVNAGVLRAFDQRLVTAASLLANMPDFEVAVESARAKGLLGKLGVHLNLTQGKALSREIRSCPRFCSDDGDLRWTHRGVWRLTASERNGIAAEWRAQITKVRAAGVRPSHLDSHHHVHTAWPIGTIAIELAKEFAVSTLRLSRNCGPDPGVRVRTYKLAFNRRIRSGSLTRMSHFGSVRDVSSVIPTAAGPVEVMTHPVLDGQGRLVDRDGSLLASSIGALGIGARMTGFRELRD